MNEVLPVIIICAVGIAAAIAYIVFLIVKTFRRIPRKKRNEFEIEDDTLIIKLGRKRK